MTRFNADLLRVARQSRGLSQAELANESSVSQGAISKFENALAEPPAEMIDKLGRALHFPVSFFYEPDRVYGLPISVHPGAMYRKRASAGQRDLDRLEAEMNVQMFRLRRLLKSVELEHELPLPRLDIDEFGGDAARIAELTRRTWLIPSGPVRELTSYIERAGCIVIRMDFEGMPVDGVTLTVPGTPPCIFLNRRQPADRQRFTLAHELGHIVMHRVPSPEMEEEANTFAASLLMPAKDIRPSLASGVTIQKLAALKPAWKVSMGALLYRAKTLGCISDNQSSYLWRQMSMLGYKRIEPVELDFPAEQPTVADDLFRVHLEELKYTESQLAHAIHMLAAEFDKQRADPKKKKHFLSVVK
ncbi:ImmA/IrrE family metallo-endopeptidase [Bosea sp. 2KB_26]|uniref:helix-turn-helix domain-containing protein n=1 Tax=Bosea sp. 2KB_26 TaxID=3237475 RepID=UPI003F8F37B0